jgi:hypothetical protein
MTHELDGPNGWRTAMLNAASTWLAKAKIVGSVYGSRGKQVGLLIADAIIALKTQETSK